MPALSDEKLIISCNNGHKQHCEELFERYYEIVYEFFRKRVDVDDSITAEDLTIVTFKCAWTGLKGFKFKSTFKTWLFKIARYRFIDYLKKKSKMRGKFPIPIGNGENEIDFSGEVDINKLPHDPLSIILRNENRAQTLAALNQLSPSHKEKSELYFLEGLKYSEIAEITGDKIGTVASQIHYARKKLKKILMPYIESIDK